MKICCKSRLLPPFQTRLVIETSPDSRDFGLVAGKLASGSPSIRVDWGDGTIERRTSLAKVVHTYPSDGIFTITISDDISEIGVRAKSTIDIYATKCVKMLREVFSDAKKLTTLPGLAFSQAVNLQRVDIRDSAIYYFYTRVFSECPNLAGALYLPNVSTILGAKLIDEPFYGCEKITEIHFSKANEAAIKGSNAWATDPKLGAANAEITFDP